VLGILSDAVAAIDAGRAPDGIVCAGLATSLGASAAVVVEVRARGESVVSYGWPDAAAAGALAAYVTHAARVPTSDVATIEVHRIGGGEWSVLLCRVRPAGAARTHDGVLVVAFTRDVPFTPEDVELWESARRPLSVLWRHVEEERAWPVLVSTPVLRSDPPEAGAMSCRELQVLALLAQGMLARAIAHRLSVSPRTVHKHLGSIYRKLGVNDRLVAVTVAQRKGLIDLIPAAGTTERLAPRPA